MSPAITKMMICPRCWGGRKDTNIVPPPACGYCLGKGSIRDVQLSEHFWLSEFLRSQTAVRQVIPNDPPPEYIPRLKSVATDLLEPVRARWGAIRINSGYRCPLLNGAISGSSTTSAHQLAWAVDADPVDPNVKHKDVVDWIIEESGIPYDQVIYEGTWIHLGRYSPSGLVRKQNLMMFPDDAGRVRYYPYVKTDARLVM